MNARRASLLAWSLAGLSLLMYAAGIVLQLGARSGHSQGAWGTVSDTLVFVPFLAFPLVGTLIATRQPGNAVGWICLADGFVWTLIYLLEGYRALGLAAPASAPFLATVWALTTWLWVPAVGLLGIFLFLVFPDGKLPSRRWRPVAWSSGALMVLVSVGIVLAPGPLTGLEEVRNPFGIEGHPWLAIAVIVAIPFFPLGILASAASLVLRFRRSGREVRQQIKWVALAASFVGLVYASVFVSVFVFVPEVLDGADVEPLWLSLLEDVMTLSFAGIPVAIGFAVLRYRLYDIDLLINRTLVYGSLTAALVSTYFGGVTLLQTFFRAVTGSESQLAVVASTLAIAALFSPVSHRVQTLIDRRFYRKKYDANKTLEAFSAKLRERTDLDALSEELATVVRETMQPEHVSLWLRSLYRAESHSRTEETLR